MMADEGPLLPCGVGAEGDTEDGAPKGQLCCKQAKSVTENVPLEELKWNVSQKLNWNVTQYRTLLEKLKGAQAEVKMLRGKLDTENDFTPPRPPRFVASTANRTLLRDFDLPAQLSNQPLGSEIRAEVGELKYEGATDRELYARLAEKNNENARLHMSDLAAQSEITRLNQLVCCNWALRFHLAHMHKP